MTSKIPEVLKHLEASWKLCPNKNTLKWWWINDRNENLPNNDKFRRI